MDDNESGKLVAITTSKSRNQQDKTQPRSILTEDEYTDTLTHIVTRDYFPAIHFLRRDDAILKARSRGDIASAVTVRRQFRKEDSEREREWQENLKEEGEAIASTTALTNHHGSKPINIRKRPRPLKHESVTGFHARVTSEDNAEFEMNQERERGDLEAKTSVVYSASANKTGRLMIETALKQAGEDAGHDEMDNHDSLLSDHLGLASDKFNASPSGIRITEGRSGNTSTQGIIKNGLFFEPQNKLQNATATKSDNLLMPPPPTRDPHSTTSSIIAFQQSRDQSITTDSYAYSSSSKQLYELVEYIPKSTEPNINPPATRFPYQNESRLLPNNHRNPNDIRRSKSHLSDTSASESTDLDASPRSLARERAAYQKAKVRENETFVAMTPLIRPGGGEGRGTGGTGVEEEPIMTWGNVASTPLVLGGGNSADGYNNSAEWEPSPLLAVDTGDSDAAFQPIFDVVDESSREAMAQNAEKMLADRAKSYRTGRKSEQKKKAEYTPKSKSDQANPFDRSASLTPAGRALLQASKRNPSSSIFRSSNDPRRSNARSKDSFGSALRTAYTPTPTKRERESSKRRNSSTPAMLRAAAAAGATPRINKKSGF